MAGPNPHGELPYMLVGDPKTTIGHPYEEFGDPSEYGYDADRFQQLRELARPRESEA